MEDDEEILDKIPMKVINLDTKIEFEIGQNDTEDK